MKFNLECRLKPVLKWVGGKSGPLSQLVSVFPGSFQRYVEPFLGGAAVYLASADEVPALLNDSNPDLVGLYEVIREDPEALMLQLDSLQSQYSEAFYYQLRGEPLGLGPDKKIERAARTIFLNKTGFNGLYRLNAKGQFNVPFGKRAKCPGLYDKANLLKVSRKLANATLTCGDFETLLASTGDGDFIYCDPPYEPLSQTSAFTSYTQTGFSKADQQRLERACKAAVQRGAMVAISNSTAPFILELYRDWNLHTIEAKRAVNSNGQARGAIAEVVATLGYSKRAGEGVLRSLESQKRDLVPRPN
jgi:DNA adenine methylase